MMKKSGQAPARATSQDDLEEIGHLFGKFSVLMRDNARMINNRVPTQPTPVLMVITEILCFPGMGGLGPLLNFISWPKRGKLYGFQTDLNTYRAEILNF